MGRDIHVRIVQFNYKTNQYEEVVLYRKNLENKITPVSAYDARDYELFDILNGDEDNYFPNKYIYMENLPDDLRKDIETYQGIEGYYNFYEINLADLKLYLYNHPKVRDYDWEDEETFDKEGWKDNPVKNFIEHIKWYINIVDMWWFGSSLDSDIRILYWFDC